METRLITQEEYYWVEGLSQQEVLFLSGLVYGIKFSLPLGSHFVYIEDMDSHLIVWMSHNSCWFKQPSKHPLPVDALNLYVNKEEYERVSKLDQLALNFIKEYDYTSIGKYTARSNAFVGLESNRLIYDRIVRFLSIPESLTPRFCVCRLSASTHIKLRELKVYKDGDNHYHKLKSGYTGWNRKISFCLNKREQLILLYSSQGLTECEIASKLHLSLPRVKSLKAEMFRQLHVKNISQAIERAYQYGLITFPIP